MNWLVDNWSVIVAGICAIICVIVNCSNFVNEPTEEQMLQVTEWLKWAVSKAEAELGSGTGQLKLRMVYDMFVQRFTWMAKCITFETFSGLVDNALVWFEDQLKQNKAVKELINEGK